MPEYNRATRAIAAKIGCAVEDVTTCTNASHFLVGTRRYIVAGNELPSGVPCSSMIKLVGDYDGYKIYTMG